MHAKATPPFFSRISTKILAGFFVVVISAGVAFYFINQDFSQKTLEQIMEEEVASAETSFENLQENDTTVLMAALAVIEQDPLIKELYLSKDREKLYEHTSTLFNTLKEKYNITHWYFILPDGTTFMRVHQKDIYGDSVADRFTFRKARDTGEPVAGIEFGKTGYALRAIIPYYGEQGELIGYLELSNEIEHLFGILKKETNNDFALVADKKNLDREEWRTMRIEAGLRDNWDDIGPEHLLVGYTIDEKVNTTCFSEENIERAEEGERIFQRIEEKGKVLQCAGFSFNEAGGQHSGSIIALLDVTDHIVFLARTQRTVVIFLILLLSIFTFFGWLFARYLSRPINRLSRIAEVIASGDFDVRADIATNDEVGLLSRNFNVMTDKLIEVRRYPESIIRSMADSLILVGNDGNIKEVNKAALDLLGYEREELLGGPLDHIVVTPEGSTGTLLGRILAETKAGGVCTAEDTFRTKDGKQIPMGVSCSIMKDEHGTVVGVVMVGKDVRTARAAEEKLKASEQELRAANQGLEESQRQLETKVIELERFNKLIVGRELKMAELKRENEVLRKKLGEEQTEMQ